MDTENLEQPIIEQKSSFKLVRNSKGYNFEIKIYGDNLESIQKDTETMRTWAEKTYGGTNEPI